MTSNETIIADRINAAAARRAGQPGVERELAALVARLDAAFDAAWRRSQRLFPLGDGRLRSVKQNTRDMAGAAHPARAAHLLLEAISLCEAYAGADDIIISNSLQRGVDVRRHLAEIANPPPTAAPVPFDVRTWARQRLGEGWAFRVDRATGAVMAKPPSAPRPAARADQVENVRIILRNHAAQLADALGERDDDRGFTVGAAA
jgi:hypothetical protein